MPNSPDANALSHLRQQRAAAYIVPIGLLIAIIVPSVLTLSTVREEVVRNAVLRFEAISNPTPLGYTVSLLIYLVPIAALLIWFFRCHAPGSFRRRALKITLLLLVPIGFALDFFLGNLIFLFPNKGAVLGIYLPGFSFHTGGLAWDLPIEEFVFYASGFFAMLLLYMWCNQVWVPAYGVSDYSVTERHPEYVVRLHWPSLWLGLLLFVLSVFYKKVLAPPEHQAGFPLYMTFLLVAAVLPGLLLHRSAQPFINWRAYSVTLLWVLLTSLLWEATLASPFGWWRYEPKWMMGLHVRAWADLPVEAVVLWIAVSYTTIAIYETVKVVIHMRQPTVRAALFGEKKPPVTAA